MRNVAIVFSFVLAFSAAAGLAQTSKTVLIITDAEGVAGICRQEQVASPNAELCELLTGEINAAVEGFLAGGAEEVTVWDGHNGSNTLSLTSLHAKAKLIIGWTGVSMTLDRKYAGVALIGQHSMANTQKGIMSHSYSSLGIQNMRLNGKPIGEIGMISALAGHFQTPVILLSGDRAAVEEMRIYSPQAETVAVKEGLGRYNCISLPALEARRLIQEAAGRAMTRLSQIQPYRVSGAATLEIEATTRNSLSPDAGLAPGTRVLDDRTVRIEGQNFWEVWTRWRIYR